ncbi:thioesterase II family protein [Streptomyces pinistramenti]|uniref:thioesterase II family protein n=1 Tax=Streptomyces pinistramenti TaxID=2884812 RepID=UPI001D08063D|nr:alpha/beta fold hydrolase [Streptomyces pinistramenti]MCB5907506.1 alpha/beta fold hydrolase [Streptomyces pinistramenti]
MAGPPAARWFHRPLPRPGARLRLVCLPYAGGGAAVFRTWPAALPDDVEVVAVRLPGRENRTAEPPYTRWPPLVADLAEALAEAVPAPYVLFGHSLGGMLGYELAVREPALPPERLVLAGCRAPDIPLQVPAVHDLPDPAFHAGLRHLAGTPEEVLRNPALLALLTPMLRADLRLAETWPAGGARPVPVPLTTFDGADDPMAPPATVAAWRRHAPHGIRAHHLPGGHHFPRDRAGAFLRLLSKELAEGGTAACDPCTSPTHMSRSVPRSAPS